MHACMWLVVDMLFLKLFGNDPFHAARMIAGFGVNLIAATLLLRTHVQIEFLFKNSGLGDGGVCRLMRLGDVAPRGHGPYNGPTAGASASANTTSLSTQTS